ncbi:uncharacterized protein LOC115067922 isoform X1 [Nannospalax galili]|uniref:uncharacterized protein LOC115067922 isoform X1 n=1 Tax=Nannospalax galili TaxID=1026970 RepID=UPI00111C4FFA|nr:uncharacterized protein LOC115067922 isoform X1 [Nannospalax galili]
MWSFRAGGSDCTSQQGTKDQENWGYSCPLLPSLLGPAWWCGPAAAAQPAQALGQHRLPEVIANWGEKGPDCMEPAASPSSCRRRCLGITSVLAGQGPRDSASRL